MEPEERLLEAFRPRGEAESVWLKSVFTFISQHLSCGPAPSQEAVSLTVSAVQSIQKNFGSAHSLPVSYRPLSVSELVSQQHLSCVSNLSWSTNQHRAWSREAELTVPGQTALRRVNLLLIGRLTEGRDGRWTLTDNSGSVQFESLSPSPLWLGRFVFLPHWNYIPHDASGQDGDRGHVELVGPPVLLSVPAEPGLAAGPAGGAGPKGAMGVREALKFLHNRVKGQRLCVYGQVGVVCPLLVVSGVSFFCWSLTEEEAELAVLVKDSSRLPWFPCLHVGLGVCVTELRVCVLRGCRGNNVLCVTERSELHTDYTHTHTPSPAHGDTHTPAQSDTHTPAQSDTHTPAHSDTHTPAHSDTHTPAQSDTHTPAHSDTHTPAHSNTHTPAHGDTHTPAHSNTHTPAHGDTQADSRLDTPLLMMSCDNTAGGEEAEPDEDSVQSGVRMKVSRVISYQGTVTEVVSEGAGLYVLDGRVGLCLAYQPRRGRSLRAGDRVELRHVHVLLRPCPDLPPSMLCACLRSSLRVTAFSGVGGASPSAARCPGDGALPRLLLQTNRDLSDYLWACYLSSTLSHSLVPSVLQQQQCVCLLSWRLMETLRGQTGRRHRDIYCEMLDRPHRCPLTQYSADPSVHQYLSVSELSLCLQDVWSSVSLRSLLPPDGPNLTRSQINSALSWSCRTLSSDPRHGDALRLRPLLLIGLLQLSSQSDVSLQLIDGTGVVCCVVTETSHAEGGGQRAFFNTAWIGCLVCVQRFTMVTERFLQSEFPSFKHLEQDEFITHTHCRVYLQFSLDHVHILSPSVAMETHLSQKGEESAKGGAEPSERKRRRTDEDESSAVAMTTLPCVSMVIRVEQKEGVSWRNVGAGPDEEKAGLRLSFSARASVIGPVVSWGRDPKNRPMTEQEAEREGRSQVRLLFSGGCTRWFPVVQPGSFYRLVVVSCQDPSVLIGSELSGRRGAELHVDSALQVGSDWRLHTLTRPLLTCTQAGGPSVPSVSQVLDCSSELVCFQGLVSERISLNDRTRKPGHTHTGVRLTVCDQTGRSLQVYLDLSHAPYPAGLLPGNTLLLSAVQRRTSRTGSVYCSFLPVSSISVVCVGDSSCLRPPPPPPMMHLARWAQAEEQRCTVGRVKGHLVCFLFLELQWSCSLCDGVYTQSCRSRCGSSSSVFQSKAKVVLEDGTAEAHVWFSGLLVGSLLGLAAAQWEGLQRALRVKGHVRVFPRGRSLVADGDPGDAVLHFLLSVCSSDVVLRSLVLTCRKRTNRRAEEQRTFSRADRDFVTRLLRPLQLTCLHLDSSLH